MTFGDLSAEGKIRAVLAAALEPISREKALNFAEVDWDSLQVNERAEVEKVFASTIVRKGPEVNLYKIKESDGLYRELGVGPKEGQRQISRILMEQLEQLQEDHNLPGSKV